MPITINKPIDPADAGAEQHKFVVWWKADVDDHGGRPSKTVPRAREGLSMREAEKLTGMPNQRVSDLGKKRRDQGSHRYVAVMIQSAQRLMKAAKRALAHDLTEATALKLSRQVWGHAAKPFKVDDGDRHAAYAAMMAKALGDAP
jgi:hypothetical protein